MNLSKEVKVGLLATITFIIAYLGFNYLKGKEIFPTTKIYYSFYKNAKGINTANPVMLNGFKVGRIQSIQILPEEDYKVMVTLAINKNIKLTNTSVAKLANNNLLGNKTIDLLIKEGQLLNCHDTLLSEVEQDLQTMFAENTLPALDEARAITSLTNKFIQNLVDNTERINTIFSNLEHTSHQLHQIVAINKKDLTLISSNMAEISSSLLDEEVGIRTLLTKLRQLTTEVENMQLGEAAIKLNNILAKLEQGPLYEHVNQAVVDLDKLLVNLRAHPSRYVHFPIFGANSIFSRNEKPAKVTK